MIGCEMEVHGCRRTQTKIDRVKKQLNIIYPDTDFDTQASDNLTNDGYRIEVQSDMCQRTYTTYLWLSGFNE